MTACYGEVMDTDRGSRLMLVDAEAFGDLLDLVGRAVPELSISDPTLSDALRGSAAQVVTTVIPEP